MVFRVGNQTRIAMWFSNKSSRSPRSSRSVLRANVRRGDAADPMPLKILLGAVAAAGLALAGWGVISGFRWSGRALYTANPEYRVLKVDVASDGVLKPAQLVDFAEVPPNANLFSVDLSEVRRKLEQIPLVARAEVRREIPSTLSIRVVERAPVARLARDANGLHYIIDHEGRLLGVREKASHLPMLLGVALRSPRPGKMLDEPRLLEGLRLLELVRERKLANFLPIEMMSIAPADYLDVRIKGGKTLWIPRKGLDALMPSADRPTVFVDFVAATMQREREAGSPHTIYNFTAGPNVIAR